MKLYYISSGIMFRESFVMSDGNYVHKSQILNVYISIISLSLNITCGVISIGSLGEGDWLWYGGGEILPRG